jgi:hypothetical protein
MAPPTYARLSHHEDCLRRNQGFQVMHMIRALNACYVKHLLLLKKPDAFPLDAAKPMTQGAEDSRANRRE